MKELQGVVVGPSLWALGAFQIPEHAAIMLKQGEPFTQVFLPTTLAWVQKTVTLGSCEASPSPINDAEGAKGDVSSTKITRCVLLPPIVYCSNLVR
eukprot:3947056-Amphidinium_carterae.1